MSGSTVPGPEIGASGSSAGAGRRSERAGGAGAESGSVWTWVDLLGKVLKKSLGDHVPGPAGTDLFPGGEEDARLAHRPAAPAAAASSSGVR